MDEKLKVTVAGTGYADLPIAILLFQRNEVVVVDIISEKGR